MEMSRQEDGAVQVRGDLHISEADQLRSALMEQKAAPGALVLDLSNVESCDAASFQLLCSLQKSAETDGKAFHISAVSAPMREAGAVLGFPLINPTNDTKK